jgi:hypothetical protein
LSAAPVRIVESNDVVFTKIRTGLYLDDLEGYLARILEAVFCPERDVSGLVLGKNE